MRLLTCPHCGQTYNPRYILYCARCGEPVPNEHGKLPKPGPYDGLGARGGLVARKRIPPPKAPRPEPARHADPWRPTAAVKDMVVEYRNRLNEAPEDHQTRYSLGLAYLYAQDWERAEAELQVVADALPHFADVHARLALCRGRLGKLERALEAAEAAAKLAPDRAEFKQLVERLRRALEHDGRTL